ncbi:response regulator [bacterium]|nr:response regulator [bacterium]
MANEKILIVEDETIVAMGIRKTLTSLGYQVTGIASSGIKALQKAEETRPDLVLMDIQLKGGMDGIETAIIIRDNFGFPVIFLTAFADNETLERAKITESYAYLVKPFQKRELNIAIEMALYKHKMEKGIRISELRFKRMAESIQDGLTMIENGKVVYVNDQACRLFGYSREEMLNSEYNMDPENTDMDMESLDDTQDLIITPYGVGIWIVDKNGNRRCIQKRFSDFRKGKKIISRYIIATDITHQAILEQERVSQEKEMSEIYQEVKMAVQKLQTSLESITNAVSASTIDKACNDDLFENIRQYATESEAILAYLNHLTTTCAKTGDLENIEDTEFTCSQTTELPQLNEAADIQSLENLMDFLDGFKDYSGILRQQDHSLLKKYYPNLNQAILLPFIVSSDNPLSNWLKTQAVYTDKTILEHFKNVFHGDTSPLFFPLSDDLLPPVYAVVFDENSNITQDLQLIESVVPAVIILSDQPSEAAFNHLRIFSGALKNDLTASQHILISEKSRFTSISTIDFLQINNVNEMNKQLQWRECVTGKQMTEYLANSIKSFFEKELPRL